METLSRLVTESLARHGFDRPVDYRRLQWSHWFRCESHHSLLIVPSKPGVFALAEEVMSISGRVESEPISGSGTRQPEAESPRRMLAVTKFFEDDDMAYVLDRMVSYQNPMQARLASGHYFVRFVIIEDPSQRRSICNALNQWIASSAEKVTGIGSHFATSLELTSGAEQDYVSTAAPVRVTTEAPARPATSTEPKGGGTENPRRDSSPFDGARPTTAPRLNSAIATTIHCSSSFPSGF